MKACRLEPTDYTPVWLMRPSWALSARSISRLWREKTSFLELWARIRPYGAGNSEMIAAGAGGSAVDAADSIFAEISCRSSRPMGMELEYTHGEGPVIHNPPAPSRRDVDRRCAGAGQRWAASVCDGDVSADRGPAWPAKIPLAWLRWRPPFTLASYMIEGGREGRSLSATTKALMYRAPARLGRTLHEPARTRPQFRYL